MSRKRSPPSSPRNKTKLGLFRTSDPSQLQTVATVLKLLFLFFSLLLFFSSLALVMLGKPMQKVPILDLPTLSTRRPWLEKSPERSLDTSRQENFNFHSRSPSDTCSLLTRIFGTTSKILPRMAPTIRWSKIRGTKAFLE